MTEVTTEGEMQLYFLPPQVTKNESLSNSIRSDGKIYNSTLT